MYHHILMNKAVQLLPVLLLLDKMLLPMRCIAIIALDRACSVLVQHVKT